MKSLAILAALIFSVHANADDAINCDDLAGLWQGERYNASLGLGITEYAYLSPDGELSISFIVNDGAHEFRTYQRGRWMCAHGYLTTMIDLIDNVPASATATYRIDLLTTDYFNYTLVNLDGAGLDGDEIGSSYENHRLEMASDGHGC